MYSLIYSVRFNFLKYLSVKYIIHLSLPLSNADERQAIVMQILKSIPREKLNKFVGTPRGKLRISFEYLSRGD